MSSLYMLDDHKNVVKINDYLDINSIAVWARFMNDFKNRRVGIDENDNYMVSTVFLGCDHNFDPSNNPLVFETMVFDNDGDPIYVERYATHSESIAGHMEACVKYGIK